MAKTYGIATDGSVEVLKELGSLLYWRVGNQVYRGPKPTATSPTLFDCDTGAPMGTRWECSVTHWQRYEAIYCQPSLGVRMEAQR